MSYAGDQGARSSEAHARWHGLLGLTSRLSEPLSAEDVARVVVDEARAAVGALTAIMWIVDDPPTHATLVRSAGHAPEALDRYKSIPLEPWLPMGDAMLRCEPLFFGSRAEFRERYEVAEKFASGEDRFPQLSYACLPLVVHGRAIGGVSLLFPQTRAFDDDERMFLTVLAHHAAQALERASLFEREKRAHQRMASLQQFTSALSSAATVEAVAMLAARVGEPFGLAGAGLWATDEEGFLRLLGDYGMSEESRKAFQRIPVDSTLPAARIARERRPLWCESERDLESEHPSIRAALLRGGAFQAYGALPLVRGDRVLGVLAFSAGRPRRFLPGSAPSCRASPSIAPTRSRGRASTTTRAAPSASSRACSSGCPWASSWSRVRRPERWSSRTTPSPASGGRTPSRTRERSASGCSR
jgi:GAF domain-containing protein